MTPAATAVGDPSPTPILFVHHGLDWITGSERCLLDLVARLDRTRYTPIVCCNAPTLRAAAAALDAVTYVPPDWEAHAAFLPNRAHVHAMREIVRRHGVGLIHANDTDPLRTLVPVARGARIPLLAHLHLPLDLDERLWSGLHQVSLAVGVSQAVVEGLRRDGFDPARIAVIYNGVDPERLAQGTARALRGTLGIDADAVVFATVASLIPRKGVDVVLRAFARLHAESRDCHLLVCGDGPLERELRALTAALGIAGRVHFLGRRDDVGAILRDAADVLVTAAREESLGLNVIEAAIFGRPPVVSDLAPHLEMVTDGEDGAVFPRDDVPALAAMMAALVADPERRRRLGAAASERARGSFLVTRYVAEFDAAYQRLLAGPPARYGWRGSWSWPPVYGRWAADAARRRLKRVLYRGNA